MPSMMKSNEYLIPLVRLGLIVNDIFGFFFVTFCQRELRPAPLILTISFAVSSLINLLFGGLAIHNGKRRVKFGRRQGLQASLIAFGDVVLAVTFLVSHILFMEVAGVKYYLTSTILLVYGMFSSMVACLTHFGLSAVYTREATKYFRENIDLECPSCHHTFGQSSASYAQIAAKERSSTIASTAANEDGVTEGDRLISEA